MLLGTVMLCNARVGAKAQTHQSFFLLVVNLRLFINFRTRFGGFPVFRTLTSVE